MMVLVKSWKNAVNSMIKAANPVKTLVLNMQAHLFTWIFIITLITAHFVMKVSINGVLCQKTAAFWTTCTASMQVSTRSMARQIFLHKECLKKHLTTKNRGLKALDNLNH